MLHPWELKAQLVCSQCKAVYQSVAPHCPPCKAQGDYIYDFDGFFTRIKVTKLTEATTKQ